jgi:hypothetical protein
LPVAISKNFGQIVQQFHPKMLSFTLAMDALLGTAEKTLLGPSD